KIILFICGNMGYKTEMIEIKAKIDESPELKDKISECIYWHYRNDPSPYKVLGSSGRTVYSTGKIETEDGEEIYLALKLYPDKSDHDRAKEEIIREIALFDFLNELSMPVPKFSIMVEVDGRYGTLTEDLTHDGRYELMESYSNMQKLKQIENYQELMELALLEWDDIFSENGFKEVPFGSLFIQKDENNQGKPVFADMDSTNIGYISHKILDEFHERYSNKEYELVLMNTK
ncbi:MAG: hypothetical protein U9O53_02695, partial [archaeon]|nr:hypothetical protein [archaeon]